MKRTRGRHGTASISRCCRVEIPGILPERFPKRFLLRCRGGDGRSASVTAKESENAAESRVKPGVLSLAWQERSRNRRNNESSLARSLEAIRRGWKRKSACSTGSPTVCRYICSSRLADAVYKRERGHVGARARTRACACVSRVLSRRY